MLYLYAARTRVGHDRTATEHHGQQAEDQSEEAGVSFGH